MMSAEYAERFREAGFTVVPNVISAADVAELCAAIEAIPQERALRRSSNVYGMRNLLEISPAVQLLALRAEVRRLVTPLLGENAFAVRATFFDKVPGANWILGWHQDRVITIREPVDVPGFSACRQKAGTWHVTPPPEIMEQMVAVRVHLDDCGPENGPLRVVPGSHRHGWLGDAGSTWQEGQPAVTCILNAGGAVVMAPLILHASSPATEPKHRRVVHIEFANCDLPGGLEWKQRVAPGT